MLSYTLRIISAIICLSIGCLATTKTRAQSKQITLEDIWLNGTFSAASVPGFNVLNDGKRYVKTEKNGDIKIYALNNNKELGTLLQAGDLMFEGKQVQLSEFKFSSDEKKLLILTEPEPIYRHSTRYITYVYDIAAKKLSLLEPAKVLHPDFSPDAQKVAYVKDNNLYIKNLASGQVQTVTSDGAKNKIINGNCDWVYEEEFSFTQAYQWSPQGNYLAYYKFDERRVKEYTMFFDEGKEYPTEYRYKYPKAGEDNSIVSIHIFNVNNNNTTTVDIGPEKDQYIPRIKWTNKDNELAVTRLNRHQNHMELLLAQATTGASTLIYDEKNKYYIDITDNLTFLPDNQSFLITSEQDGYNHIYRRNWVKNELTQLTHGVDEVKDVLGVNTRNGQVFYTITEDVINTSFYLIDLKKKTPKLLSTQKGTHSITPCNGFNYFVDRYSSSQQVPTFKLIDAKGKVVRVLEENKKLEARLKEYQFGNIAFLTIPNRDGVSLNAYMIKPANFDATKKYPVLFYQYSGPGSQQVLNKFPLDHYWWHQLLVQKGYIVVVADGTGTGGRGEAFKKKTYLQLGKLESDDQIDVANYLGKQNYVDAGRIGIWGWSFGGFMSTICVLKAPETFKAAIAVAPVTNWRLYDNIYTERFMRKPDENKDGYDDNSPLQMAKNLKGKYLLIHGMADDNVHLQNATELSKALVDANKNFDAFYYTNKNHSIYGGNTRYNLYVKMTDFILNNL
ncbi:MAG: S9 family peptidase [Sphingobacteriales bacterium]|nr:MAG: S9 family peptidase [Sphingobacteriales bacterium]